MHAAAVMLAAGVLGLQHSKATAALAGSSPTTVSERDRAAIIATLDAIYAVISGPKGQVHDLARIRKLFTPDARLRARTAWH